MVNKLPSSLVPLAGFSPLPVSPDKIGCYHDDIDDGAYRKKTDREIIPFDILSDSGLLDIGGNRATGRSRFCWIHSKTSRSGVYQPLNRPQVSSKAWLQKTLC